MNGGRSFRVWRREDLFGKRPSDWPLMRYPTLLEPEYTPIALLTFLITSANTALISSKAVKTKSSISTTSQIFSVVSTIQLNIVSFTNYSRRRSYIFI